MESVADGPSRKYSLLSPESFTDEGELGDECILSEKTRSSLNEPQPSLTTSPAQTPVKKQVCFLQVLNFPAFIKCSFG
jgi:hypothetical protein